MYELDLNLRSLSVMAVSNLACRGKAWQRLPLGITPCTLPPARSALAEAAPIKPASIGFALFIRRGWKRTRGAAAVAQCDPRSGAGCTDVDGNLTVGRTRAVAAAAEDAYSRR
jgi:hypothetical protein